MKPITSNKVHIEVARTRKAIEQFALEEKLVSYLCNLSDKILSSRFIKCTAENSNGLEEYVELITIDENAMFPLMADNLIFDVFTLNVRGPEIETFETGMGNDVEEVPSSNHWLLPSHDLVGLWESLLYEDGLKEKVLKFVETTMLFSKQNVNTNIISTNRTVLLHGPPGTGKTSLCKAIAQKLAIRLKQSYKYTHLVEINSHSLFSKWFSESGKLVMKLFTQIKDIAEDPQSLVCVLIDEVESIAYSRSSISGDEPRDSLRVVNAVLTQLDQIRGHPNVLILTTSNLTSTIDIAFIDRADIKQFIGYPSIKAIYEIFSQAIRELIRVNILLDGELLPYNSLENIIENMEENSSVTNISLNLLRISKQSIGLSGRTLRKIPFLAHALFVETEITTLERFIEAMDSAIHQHWLNEKALLGENHFNGK